MDLAVEVKDNALLGRRELTGTISYDGALPSLAEVKKAVLTKEKAKDDMVFVKKVQGNFGTRKADVVVYVYTDEASRNRLEGKPKEEPKPAAEEKPAEEAKPAPTEEAAPAEEKKEEVKAE